MKFFDYKIKETLDYYDGPLVFTTEINGVLYLAYLWGDNWDEYMFFQTNEEDLKELKQKKITMKKFFEKSSIKNKAYLVKDNRSVYSEEEMSWDEVEKTCFTDENYYLNSMKEEDYE